MRAGECLHYSCKRRAVLRVVAVRLLEADIDREKDRVINMIRDTVVPQPTFRITSCKMKGKPVVALFVEEGDSPPYGLYPDKPVYYIRRGTTTFPANQAEVRAFARKNAAPSATYPFHLYRG